MEHTLRSEVPRTFSWVGTSRSVLYLHATLCTGRESEAVSAEHTPWVKLAGSRAQTWPKGYCIYHILSEAVAKLSFAQVECVKVTGRLH